MRSYNKNLMSAKYCFILACILSLTQCQPPQTAVSSLQETLEGVPAIEGKADYLNSPFVTAGDRLYMVGHQNGQFPDLGWHVTGEMGGIWNHPIKLMDGFTAALRQDGQTYCLSEADAFINYPFANKHIFSVNALGIGVERFQFAPDAEEALAVEYLFRNNTENRQAFTFEFNGLTDLRPVWLGERTGMEDGRDAVSWDESAQCLIGKDDLNDWYVVWGSKILPADHQIGSATCDFERRGRGANASLSFSIELAPHEQIALPIVIAGSYTSLEAAQKTLQKVQTEAEILLQTKKKRYQALAEQAKLTIPDKELQEAFEWVKYNTDWLIRDVPEIGRALSAGIPDYPWWFGCDNTYTLAGVLASGRTDIAYTTLNLLQKLSEQTNGNGRIIHEASTNGVVFNPGNINETPHFASMVRTMYDWTGDKNFLNQFYPTVKKGLQWLLENNDADGNLLPDGFGMMEIHGLDSEMIDVAVYTQKAFADAAFMAREMGEEALAAEYQAKADQLQETINTDFWVPEFNSYADFIGTAGQARHLIEDAIVRADTLGKPWAVAELEETKAKIDAYPSDKKQGFVLYHNWVVNTPMETGIAEPEKALAALKTGAKYVNPFGLFVTGIDRDETAGSDEGSFAAQKKVFSYVGAVMTLPTGVQAIAENNYGRPDAALEYLQRLIRSFSFALPGSIYEVSPDFGMMTQAWNMYSLAVPIVQQFFGVKPEAGKRVVRIQPQMPSDWEEASLENILVGDNSLNIVYTKGSEGVELRIDQSEPDWRLILVFPEGQYEQWLANGRAVSPETNAHGDWIEASGAKIVVAIR